MARTEIHHASMALRPLKTRRISDSIGGRREDPLSERSYSWRRKARCDLSFYVDVLNQSSLLTHSFIENYLAELASLLGKGL